MVSKQPAVKKKSQTYNNINMRKMIKLYDPIYNKWNQCNLKEC